MTVDLKKGGGPEGIPPSLPVYLVFRGERVELSACSISWDLDKETIEVVCVSKQCQHEFRDLGGRCSVCGLEV
jgi:hypothetical protein